MSIHLYDEALKNKLKEVFENVVDASEDKALQYSENGEALVNLPLISFWRLNNNLSTDYAQFPLKNIGRRSNKMINNSKVVNYELNFNLEYQIDIWSDRRSECDDLFTELVLFLLQEPNLVIHDPNLNQSFNFPLQITETVTNVDLTQFSEQGNLYRQVITISIPNATVFFPVKRKIIKIRAINWFVENMRGDRFDL
jgi:hypothetical protein